MEGEGRDNQAAACRLNRGLGAVGLALILAGSVAPARAQGPAVADTARRSGLVSRYVPIVPYLPPDRDRNTFYYTRWDDKPTVHCPNSPCHNGLYGRPWKQDCTQCFAPSFHGIPGQNSLGPHCPPCHPVFRLVQNLAHPFKPVGYYYSGGCYSPIYDLDPLVVGPGPYPWPWFCKKPTGG